MNERQSTNQPDPHTHDSAQQDSLSQDSLMNTITTLLETRPPVAVPEDFAARVLSRVPARVPLQTSRRLMVPTLTRTQYGRSTVFAAVLLLLAAMILFAPATRNSIVWTGMQTVLFAELAALALWFGWLRSKA